ncbi:MAG: heavy metal-associated domain-containing protein, partial [Armatimonadota bacterium]
MTTTSTTTSNSTFSAPDISCGGCANAIRRSLGTVPGIKDINVDVEAKTVTVTQDGPEDPQ